LNALNPNACPENQRIYEFESVDRDRREVRLTRKNGRPIAPTTFRCSISSHSMSMMAASG
jgi:hypothetical protein